MNEIEVENKKEPQPDWYQALVQDVNELIFEGIIETKWRIGKRILRDELKFEKPEYGSKRVHHLAEDIGISKREVYRCIQFAKKVSHVSELKKFKGRSWRWVCNEYLPESTREKKSVLDQVNELIALGREKEKEAKEVGKRLEQWRAKANALNDDAPLEKTKVLLKEFKTLNELFLEKYNNLVEHWLRIQYEAGRLYSKLEEKLKNFGVPTDETSEVIDQLMKLHTANNISSDLNESIARILGSIDET